MVGLAGDRVYDVQHHGDPVEIVHQPGHNVSVALVLRAMTLEPDLLPQVPAADALPEEIRELARRRMTS
ncbi:hypothetical protein [Nonomuraea sp. NPDC050786]|uniref:hypothetical protein n=1 Tax=Nonomuraea sp. NPDC050786 TaxID=3154840 RepID=UPI0033C6E897